MRAFGSCVCAGIHDDASYAALKGARPLLPLATRIAAIRPLVDSVFVIPGTDPTPYIQVCGILRAELAGVRCGTRRCLDRPDCFPRRLPPCRQQSALTTWRRARACMCAGTTCLLFQGGSG